MVATKAPEHGALPVPVIPTRSDDPHHGRTTFCQQTINSWSTLCLHGRRAGARA